MYTNVNYRRKTLNDTNVACQTNVMLQKYRTKYNSSTSITTKSACYD